MKKKILIGMLIVLLALAGIFVGFREPIAVRVAPKAVLTRALQETALQLQQRWEQSPVSVVAGHLEEDGLYSARLDLRMDSDLLGSVNYNMDLSVDTRNNRLLAEGTVQTQRNDLDLTLYLDKVCMAVSSRDFLGGGYYGITYESFPEDIRSIPLMSMFIGEATISGWETSVAGVQSVMNRSYSLPQLPELSPEALREVVTAVLLLPGNVQREQISVNGSLVQGYRIDYSASGEEVRELLSGLIEPGEGTDGHISASFWLYDDRIVKIVIRGQVGDNSVSCSIELPDGGNPVTLRLARQEEGQERGMCIVHEAETENGILRENWSVFDNFEGTGEPMQIRYKWEAETGRLTPDGDGAPVLTIQETENGLTLITDDLPGLLSCFSCETVPGSPMLCELTLGPGESVKEPAYKNLDKWRLEDLLVLLRGIGGLFGLDTR